MLLAKSTFSNIDAYYPWLLRRMGKTKGAHHDQLSIYPEVWNPSRKVDYGSVFTDAVLTVITTRLSG